MADSDAVKQFESITGADANTAQFFLNASRNDLDSAVNAFFEADGVIPVGAHGTTGANSAASAAPPARTTAPAQPASSSSSRPSRTRRLPASSVATLASLGGGDNKDDEDESGKNYYAGGEKSGQMIQDPRGRDGASSASGAGGAGGGASSDRQLAEAILERARQRMGTMDEDERERFGENQRFTGAGYRLGETGGEAAARPAIVGRRNVTRTISFYDNGFVVDDGPLRSYEDPANAAFLADVNKGVVPREMEEPGIGDVSITLLDKKGEKYDPPRPRIVPFSGGGQRLGAQRDPAAAPAAAPAVGDAAATVVVDDALPVAVIQVRLSDGTRIRARLNEHHTVGQLRAFVTAARPGVGSFNLATTFPRKELSDDSQSVKDAGLKGAVVVQSLK